MGGNFSKDDKSKANNIYAELITGKSPPIKVLLNEQITSTAVDSLKDSLNDSKEFVNLFANNLVIEVLKDKNTAKTFGNFLNYTFSFESTKAPTRSLIYWSIMSDTSIGNISFLSTTQICTWMNLYGKNQIVDVLDHYLLRKSFQTIYIHPLLLWTLQQEHIVISPLSNIIADSLLYTKDDIKNGIKYAITESLKSEEVKNAVRNTILSYLMKVGNRSSTSTGGIATAGERHMAVTQDVDTRSAVND